MMVGKPPLRNPGLLQSCKLLAVTVLFTSTLVNSVSSFHCPRGCVCDRTMSGIDVTCHSVMLEDILSNLPTRVFKLSICNTNISVLASSSFANYPYLETPKIIILELTQTNIIQVMPGALDIFSNLQFLNLSTNSIQILSKGTLASLTKLQSLDLSKNILNQDGLHGLSGLKSLTSLNLSSNIISDVSCSSIVREISVKHLQRLDIIGNSISILDSCVFLGSENVQFANFSNNNILTIDDGTFTNVPNLDTLSLRNNRIDSNSTIPISKLSNLELLSITGNNLLEVPSSIQNMSSLKTLYLSDNPIRVLRVGDLDGLTGLENFFFRRLPDLHTIESGALDSLPSLRVLAIEQNPSLKAIPLETISKSTLKSLVHVMLSNNGVTQFNEVIFRSMPSLERALIGGNPLFCDCKAKWMRQVMEKPGLYPWAVEWLGPAGPVCDAPKPMKKMMISEVGEEDLTCDDPHVIALTSEDTDVTVGDNVTLQVHLLYGDKRLIFII